MREFAWIAGVLAILAGGSAAITLLDPGPATNDLGAFSAVAFCLLFGFLAAALATRPRWWHWWFPAAWLGMGVATLALAYKDSFGPELRHFGPLTLLWHAAIHLLIAPIELFFGFAVGFLDPRAPLYVLASVAVFLFGAELIRRRLWPSRGQVTAPEPASR